MSQAVERKDHKFSQNKTIRLIRQKKEKSKAVVNDDDHMPEVGVIVLDLQSKKVHFARKFTKEKIIDVVWPHVCTNKKDKDFEEDKKYHESQVKLNL